MLFRMYLALLLGLVHSVGAVNIANAIIDTATNSITVQLNEPIEVIILDGANYVCWKGGADAAAIGEAAHCSAVGVEEHFHASTPSSVCGNTNGDENRLMNWENASQTTISIIECRPPSAPASAPAPAPAFTFNIIQADADAEGYEYATPTVVAGIPQDIVFATRGVDSTRTLQSVILSFAPLRGGGSRGRRGVCLKCVILSRL